MLSKVSEDSVASDLKIIRLNWLGCHRPSFALPLAHILPAVLMPLLFLIVSTAVAQTLDRNDRKIVNRELAAPNTPPPGSKEVFILHELPDVEMPTRDSGYTNFKTPLLSGDRTLSVRIRNTRLDQGSIIGEVPDSGRLRLELQFRLPDEDWRPSRVLIPTILPVAGEAGMFEARAVLPQGQFLNPQPSGNDRNAYPRQQVKVWHKNPLTIPIGQSIVYRWQLRDDQDKARSTTERQFEMPRPLAIAVMGDSYGAGEGAPENDKPKLNRPSRPSHAPTIRGPNFSNSDFEHFASWHARRSHRSSKSGLIRSIARFKRDQPEVWVVHKHTAISSATIGNDPRKSSGMFGSFKGDRELFIPTTLRTRRTLALVAGSDWGVIPERLNVRESQIDQIENWVVEENLGFVDIVLLSAGGNDAGFGDAITAALTGRLASNFDGFEEDFQNNLTATNEDVDDLFRYFNELIKPRSVLWTNYPNLTRDERGLHRKLADLEQSEELAKDIAKHGTAGATIGGILGFIINPLATAPGAATGALNALANANANPSILLLNLLLDGEDLYRAEKLLVDELNPSVANWCADKPSCHLVDIQNRSLRHGISAIDGERWFNTFIDSQLVHCGGLDCAVHPTAIGFERIYAEPVAASIAERYERQREFELSLTPLELAGPDLGELRRRLPVIQQRRNTELEKLALEPDDYRSLKTTLRKLNPEYRLTKKKYKFLKSVVEKLDPASLDDFIKAAGHEGPPRATITDK